MSSYILFQSHFISRRDVITIVKVCSDFYEAVAKFGPNSIPTVKCSLPRKLRMSARFFLLKKTYPAVDQISIQLGHSLSILRWITDIAGGGVNVWWHILEKWRCLNFNHWFCWQWVCWTQEKAREKRLHAKAGQYVRLCPGRTKRLPKMGNMSVCAGGDTTGQYVRLWGGQVNKLVVKVVNWPYLRLWVIIINHNNSLTLKTFAWPHCSPLRSNWKRLCAFIHSFKQKAMLA